MSDATALPTSHTDLGPTMPHAGAPRRVGIVVHPSRSVDRPLAMLREWADRHEAEVVQMPAAYSQRRVARPGDPAESDLIVSIGGDGTTLAALRIGAEADRPVLGIACGSLGALATVSVADVTRSLERFRQGEWLPRRFPALTVSATRCEGSGESESLFALNDAAVLRAGGGQARVTVVLDGAVYGRMAGDGVVVSTPLGSSGYAISAGGPLLASGLDGFVFTPLPKHGGFSPPLVAGPKSVLELEIGAGFAGARLEIDGQVAEKRVRSLTIGLRPDVATMVGFPDQEPLLAGLRRRGIILDSPRLVVDTDPERDACPD
ncbi:MAG TPA: NAD(+)/NADH kinase [Solirubrobacteraceae bacterium]|nr:NAD(+)/NADH kinase [Solirubrobacteraceae bacterium]